jgi:hypothetical protein
VPRFPPRQWMIFIALALVATAGGFVFGRRVLNPASDPAALAEAMWASGSLDDVRKMVRTELDRIPESDGPARARVYLRFGIVDTNPDGQAAVFNLACVADPRVCDHMREAAEREVKLRFVAPGNVLPLSLTGGHPR